MYHNLPAEFSNPFPLMAQECAVLLPAWLLPSANVLLAACLKQPDNMFKERKQTRHWSLFEKSMVNANQHSEKKERNSTMFTWALFVTSFARVAKKRVFRDCSTWLSAGLRVHMMAVRAFPPSECCNMRVSFESL
jgi:hypothetical protein